MNDRLTKDLEHLFTRKGYNPVVGTIYQRQDLWVNWYRGEVNDFHYYSIKTVGGSSVDKHKPSLNMAKKVSEDWTSLLFNERSELLVNDVNAQKVLDNVMYDNNFKDEITNFIELCMVYGTGAIVEYKADNETKMNFIYGNKIMVLSYENTTPTEIAIIQTFQEGKKTYHHIQYHTLEDMKYRIKHEVYESKSNGLGNEANLNVLFSDSEIEAMRHEKEVDGVIEVEYYIEYETTVPHFQIFKPAITNNFDVASPMGVSIFANSISVLEGSDNKYHSFDLDSINSRKRIFVSDDATKQNKSKDVVNGEVVLRQGIKYFDQDDTVIQSMTLPEDDPMRFFEPTYNAQPHIDGINHDLNLLSSKVGLGTGYYSFDPSGGITATEVIHKNSDTWRNRQKHLLRLELVLQKMMYSILYLEKEQGRYGGNLELEYTVVFDDSIVVDDEKRLENMKADANDGFLPKWRYVMERYKLNEQEAKLWVAESDEEDTQANVNFFNNVNNDEEEQD